MLFPYIYVPHQMERMQTFIGFIFFEVWCKAPIGLAFHPDLFDGDPDLREVMSEFGFSAQAPDRGKAFYKSVKSIYEDFASLPPAQIDQLRQWYRANNEIEKICANDLATSPARYADIKAINQGLAEQLEAFYKGLYAKDLLGLAALRAKVGSVADHYKTFVTTNKSGTCPFCGIADIKGLHQTKREAYDHYLPKSLYPFNSINFRNLAPACHECNSTYKSVKDPAHNAAGRRKAFYPYAAPGPAIEIGVALRHSDIDRLTPEDITLQFGPAAINEEIDTWKDVYGIEERYKAKLCGESGGQAWLNQMLDEWKELGRDPNDFLATLAWHTQKRPYADCNFLKKALLEAYHTAAILSRAQPVA